MTLFTMKFSMTTNWSCGDNIWNFMVVFSPLMPVEVQNGKVPREKLTVRKEDVVWHLLPVDYILQKGINTLDSLNFNITQVSLNNTQVSPLWNRKMIFVESNLQSANAIYWNKGHSWSSHSDELISFDPIDIC